MGTSIAKAQLGTLSKEELMAGLARTRDESKTQNHAYLQFSGREGRYSVANGTDEPDQFPTGTKVLLNLFESKKGYVCWKDGKAIDNDDNYSLFQALPSEDSLEDHGPYSTDPQKREGWKMQYSVFVKSLTDNKQYILKLSSASATRAFGALIDEIHEQGSLHDITAETPVIALGVESFKSNGHKNYKPTFEIDSWKANPPATGMKLNPPPSDALQEVLEQETTNEAHDENTVIPASRNAKKK